nr:hypothetical protein [Tanacetum cinerariifolium]
SSLEETTGRYLEESSKRQDNFKECMKRFIERTYENLKIYDSAIKGLENKVEQLAQAVHASMTNDLKSINQVKTIATTNSPNTHCSNSPDSNIVLCTFGLYNLVEKENVMKVGEMNKNPKLTPVIGTFASKVKRQIAEEQERTFMESLENVPANTPLIDTLRKTPNYTKSLQELVFKKKRIKEVSMVKLNARCSAVMQNELPSKEKDPGFFPV